jgi:Carbon-nitrogen hydrolase
MSTLKIGLAQCRQTGDLEANMASVFRFLEEAARAGVQILCFPETQTVGYRVDLATPPTPVPVAQLEDLHGQAARPAGPGLRPGYGGAARRRSALGRVRWQAYGALASACFSTNWINSGHSKNAGDTLWPSPAMSFTVTGPPPAS